MWSPGPPLENHKADREGARGRECGWGGRSGRGNCLRDDKQGNVVATEWLRNHGGLACQMELPELDLECAGGESISVLIKGELRTDVLNKFNDRHRAENQFFQFD